MSNDQFNIIEEKIITGVVKEENDEINAGIEIGKDGATFTPHVDEESNLSWSNNLNLENPPTVNIRGKQGYTFTPNIDDECTLSWSNNGNLENPKPINIKGDKGDTPYIGLITLTDINKLFR